MIATYVTENEFGTGEVRSWASLLDVNCQYLADMLWCQAYALEQREAMGWRALTPSF